MNPHHRLRIAAVTVAFLAAAVVAACGSEAKPRSTAASAGVSVAATAPTTAAPGTTAPIGAITVFAASSLTEAFTEIGSSFEAANPGAKVRFNFAGSGDLVAQIRQGAPADAFASADDSNMNKLIDAGEAVGKPIVVARNTLEIITEPGNPKGIATLGDLAKPDLIIVLCAETVPCGKLAAQALAAASVAVTPKSLEDKVKGVVVKVTTGEADAGIVFATDVIAAGARAGGVEIPASQNAVTNYPVTVTKEATNAGGGSAFISYLASPSGQAILAKFGFLAP